MDEQPVETEVPTVGQQLRAAREERGLTLEDVAAQTRIPRRHLESLEEGAWDRLPAPTYTTGFAKSYATAVGLDRTRIGEQLRGEMGGQRAATAPVPEVFEAADPARSMPKWLIIGAVVAVIAIVLLMSWLNERSLTDNSAPANEAATETPAPAPPPAPTAATAQGPVVVAATGPAWIQVTDQGKILFSGELQPGQTYAVPATATAPLLKAGKPENLRITVGNAVAPAIGPAGRVAANVSLLGPDLMRTGAATPAPPATANLAPATLAPPPVRPQPRQAVRPASPPPAVAAAASPAHAPVPESNTAAQ